MESQNEKEELLNMELPLKLHNSYVQSSSMQDDGDDQYQNDNHQGNHVLHHENSQGSVLGRANTKNYNGIIKSKELKDDQSNMLEDELDADLVVLDESLQGSILEIEDKDAMIGSQEFTDEHINLFFESISVNQLNIPEYEIPDEGPEDIQDEGPGQGSELGVNEGPNEIPDMYSMSDTDLDDIGEIPDVEIMGSNSAMGSGVLDSGEFGKIFDSQMQEEDSFSMDLNALDEILSDSDNEPAVESHPQDDGPNDDEGDDFFKKVQVNQELYDQFGNLLAKPKSIFTTLDRFYVRPLSYLNLDIVNQAEYSRQSQALDAALAFLNSEKCKALLAEVGPPESAGLLTVNIKDPALKYTLIPPKSRKEYKEYRSHRPWFMWIITFIQAALVVASFILNFINTGGVIQTNPFNPMIGPNPGIMINLGARYLPCMKYIPANWTNVVCPVGTKMKPLANESCTLAQICNSNSEINPDQGWRFVTPAFLHSGILHFVLNAFFQLRVATNFEREVGSLPIATVFGVSSVGGYMFGGALSSSAKDTPSVGSSGGLFGIIACLTVDLFMNWALLKNPNWEAFKTIANIVVAFVMGWLPGVDNFAHIGGYITGLLMAVLVTPKIYFSREDRKRKTIMQYLSVPFLVIFFSFCLYAFYKVDIECKSCQYLNCIPGLPWCEQKGVKL